MENNKVNNTSLMTVQSDEEVTIDLREVFFALKKRALLIIAVGLLCGCIALAATIFLMTPIYTSTASVLVLSKETTLTSIADLQLGNQLANDYEILISSTTVLEGVIKNLGLDTTPENLRRNVTVNNPQDTRILELTVKNSDPQMAKLIVDELAAVASAYVADKMEVIPPKIIENGKIATVQTSPSVKKNVAIGVLLGLLLSGGLVVVLSVMDDTIKSEDDMMKYLGISMLASIPDRKDFINTKAGRKKAKKRS